MAEYHLQRLNDQNAGAWEAFNAASPEGSPFHTVKWKQLVERNSGTRSRYLLLFRGDDVVGLLPLIEHKTLFFQGFAPANDPARLHMILKEHTDPAAMHHAIRGLQHLKGRHRPPSYLLLSSLKKETLDAITEHPCVPLDGLGDMVTNLRKTPPDSIWDGFSSRSGQRKHIRRFEEDGFEITEARAEGDLRRFYEHYEKNITYIGGTLRPFSYFADLLDTMSDEVRITILSKGSLIAGGSLTLQDVPRKTVYGIYLSLNRTLPKRYSPTLYLYWDAITWAWENHFERFSFGMQGDDANHPRYRLKDHFLARFEPLYSVQIPLTTTFRMFVRFMQWRSGRTLQNSKR